GWLPRGRREKAFVEKDNGMHVAVNRGFRRSCGPAGFSVEYARPFRFRPGRAAGRSFSLLLTEISFRKAPHPVPLSLRWREGGRRLGAGCSFSDPEIYSGNHSTPAPKQR